MMWKWSTGDTQQLYTMRTFVQPVYLQPQTWGPDGSAVAVFHLCPWPLKPSGCGKHPQCRPLWNTCPVESISPTIAHINLSLEGQVQLKTHFAWPYWMFSSSVPRLSYSIATFVFFGAGTLRDLHDLGSTLETSNHLAASMGAQFMKYWQPCFPTSFQSDCHCL